VLLRTDLPTVSLPALQKLEVDRAHVFLVCLAICIEVSTSRTFSSHSGVKNISVDAQSRVKWRESPLFEPKRVVYQRPKRRDRLPVCPDSPQRLRGLANL
jgi:DsbC/DsbD-like thiol-disulfide interchange protein